MVGKELKPVFTVRVASPMFIQAKAPLFITLNNSCQTSSRDLVHGFESITVIAIFKESADLRI